MTPPADIRVIHATTGELLRHLTLDPTRNYQLIMGKPFKGTVNIADVDHHERCA